MNVWPFRNVIPALAGLLFISGLCLTERAVAAQEPSPSKVQPLVASEPRILHFPRDRSVGRISVRNSATKRAIETIYFWIDGCEWEEQGEARGAVMIPRDKVAKLDLRPDGTEDWSWLGRLDPDDLYNVTVLSPRQPMPPIGDSLMGPLSVLTGLRELDLWHSAVTDRGLAALKSFTRLERFWMPPGVTNAAMAHTAKLHSLTALYIEFPTRLTVDGLRHIEALNRLEELSLSGSGLDDRALKHLAALPHLDYLKLGPDPKFGDRGMEYLKSVPSLRILNLSRCPISDRGLADISTLPNLERLSLYGVSGISNQGLACLAKMPRLRMLDLNDPQDAPSPITDDGLAHLRGCTSLEALHLPDSITDTGLAHVAKIKDLRYLWAAGPSMGPITDAGLKHIASLRDLEHLMVGGSEGITDQGMAHLAELRRLKTLSVLTDSTGVTDEGLAHVARLKELTSLDINICMRGAGGMTIAGVNQLNALAKLHNLSLSLSHLKRGDAVLDLSRLTKLDQLALGRLGDTMKDEDLACLSGLTQLRWLQGVGGVTDKGMAQLAGLTNLERLAIGKSPGFGDEGMRYLSAMRRLTLLVLLDCGFTDQGLRSLEGLTGLTHVSLSSSHPISPAAYDRLDRALPNIVSLSIQPSGLARAR